MDPKSNQSIKKDNNSLNQFQSNRNYFTISIYALAVITIAAIIISLIANFSYTCAAINGIFQVLTPFTAAFFIAYILNPIVITIDTKLLERVMRIKGKTARKILSILLAYLMVIGIVAVSLIYIIPQIITSISDLTSMSTDFYDNTIDYLKNLESHFPYVDFKVIEEKINNAFPQIISYGTDFVSNLFPALINLSVSIVRVLINIILSLVISCYMLIDKQRLKRNAKRILYSLVPQQKADSLLVNLRECDSIFGRFIVGKSIDSLIIGILCFIAMSLLHLPYALLISVIVGITNMIPYFGPFIGAVPGVLIYLVINPLQSFIFAVMILILQQFDGLYLGPKILGESTGLRPLWVIFGITVGGACWGVIGMFIGVPTVAVIAHLLNKVITHRLDKRRIVIEEK